MSEITAICRKSQGVQRTGLWGEALAKGYSAPHWMTYKQAEGMGAQVRKGEHGSLVVYANSISKTEADDHGQESERAISFMKGCTVFNVEQVDGLPAHFTSKPTPPQPVQRIEQAEAFFVATGATIQRGGSKAFYAPSRDLVQRPPRESFRDAESYCATLTHERTHWTSHPSRLARELGKRFGGHAYVSIAGSRGRLGGPHRPDHLDSSDRLDPVARQVKGAGRAAYANQNCPSQAAAAQCRP